MRLKYGNLDRVYNIMNLMNDCHLSLRRKNVLVDCATPQGQVDCDTQAFCLPCWYHRRDLQPRHLGCG